MAQPRTDSRIPELVNTTGLAQLAEVARPWVAQLYGAGLVPGRQVGGMVVFLPKRAKKLRDNPNPMASVVDDKIPPLMSSEVAAAACDVSRQALDRWFRIGKLPGRRVSTHFLVFRSSVVKSAAGGNLLTAGGEPVDDAELPELVATAEAAEILGLPTKQVYDRWRLGKLPGRAVESDSDAGFRPVFRREVVEQQVGVTPPMTPAVDKTIPELVTTAIASELTGLSPKQVEHLYKTGQLPGRVVTGGSKGGWRVVFRPEMLREHGLVAEVSG